MTAPDYVAQVADVIREFIVEAVGFDNGELMTAQAENLALNLAAAGLIPTHTAQTYLNGRVVERGVTDWKDATDD